MTNAEKADRYDEIIREMKRQRDGFRDGKLGAEHSRRNRNMMASLLDWFVQEFGE